VSARLGSEAATAERYRANPVRDGTAVEETILQPLE
jgi:hypothetical protein